MLHPSALTDYDTTENTIVVSCEDTGKTTTVSFDDILVLDEYSYYYYGTESYTEFDGEGQLTGAVNYNVTDIYDHTIRLPAMEKAPVHHDHRPDGEEQFTLQK